MSNTKKSSVNFENIPSALKKRNQWIGWNFEKNEEGRCKVIKRHMVDEYRASVHVPDDWVDFETCKKCAYKFDGVGFVITRNDPFVVWRLENCCDEKTGKINKKAKIVMNHLDSYSEYSRSCKGLRIIVKGIIGPLGRKNDRQKIQVFDEEKFLIVTGNRIVSAPKAVRSRKKICAKLHENYFKRQIGYGLKDPAKRLKWLCYKYPTYSYLN